jgi:hypothetical protein
MGCVGSAIDQLSRLRAHSLALASQSAPPHPGPAGPPQRAPWRAFSCAGPCQRLEASVTHPRYVSSPARLRARPLPTLRPGDPLRPPVHRRSLGLWPQRAPLALRCWLLHQRDRSRVDLPLQHGMLLATPASAAAGGAARPPVHTMRDDVRGSPRRSVLFQRVPAGGLPRACDITVSEPNAANLSRPPRPGSRVPSFAPASCGTEHE